MYKNLIVWISFSGAIVLEKIVGFFVFWVFFPIYLNRDGVIQDAGELFLVLFEASLIFTIVYDAIGRDLFKITAVKQKCLNLLARIKSRLGIKKEIVWLRRFSWVTEFLFFSWQLLPPLALLCLRDVNQSRSRMIIPLSWWDIRVLFASSLFATVFWTLLHKGILFMVYDWIKKWI
ncbi:MAG: hypothetical protein WC735_01525 [Candidatus Paceibacterota bacterium]|jgi:hypothetical protein